MARLHLPVCASQEEPDGIRCGVPRYPIVSNLIQLHPGMLWDDVAKDPRLGTKRNQLVVNAVNRLATARMVNWNRSTGALQITDLGRIAAKYYIRLASIEVFNQKFKPKMTEADVLTMLSYSTEVRLVRLSVSGRFLTSLCA